MSAFRRSTDHLETSARRRQESLNRAVARNQASSASSIRTYDLLSASHR